MTIVFMSLVAAVIAERTSVRVGLWLWPVLLALGILSVLQWRWSEMRGAGDLRFYAAVQVYAALVLLVMTFFPTAYTRGPELGVGVALYVVAKLLETYDKQIFTLGQVVSGHTLKHLAAALPGIGFCGCWRKERSLVLGVRSWAQHPHLRPETCFSGSALVVNRELEAVVGREQLRDLTQAFRHRSGRQQRVIALPQIVVVHI